MDPPRGNGVLLDCVVEIAVFGQVDAEDVGLGGASQSQG
jgi:hypothetical protein